MNYWKTTMMKPETAVMTLGISLIIASLFAIGNPVFAEADWKTEFDDICSKTTASTELTADELKQLIARCERLKPEIEKLKESQRKVYLRRLEMCRNLLSYVLESKEKK